MGLRLLLERQPDLEVVGEAADGRQAVELAAQEKPDVVVMDIAMPHLNGVEAARQIVNRAPQTAVVILSMHSDESYVIRSLKAGARAYLLKDSAESDLIDAIHAIMRGEVVLQSSGAASLERRLHASTGGDGRRRYV